MISSVLRVTMTSRFSTVSMSKGSDTRMEKVGFVDAEEQGMLDVRIQGDNKTGTPLYISVHLSTVM